MPPATTTASTYHYGWSTGPLLRRMHMQPRVCDARPTRLDRRFRQHDRAWSFGHTDSPVWQQYGKRISIKGHEPRFFAGVSTAKCFGAANRRALPLPNRWISAASERLCGSCVDWRLDGSSGSCRRKRARLDMRCQAVLFSFVSRSDPAALPARQPGIVD